MERWEARLFWPGWIEEDRESFQASWKRACKKAEQEKRNKKAPTRERRSQAKKGRS